MSARRTFDRDQVKLDGAWIAATILARRRCSYMDNLAHLNLPSEMSYLVGFTIMVDKWSMGECERVPSGRTWWMDPRSHGDLRLPQRGDAWKCELGGCLVVEFPSGCRWA